MATEKQIKANQKNAELSTGPKTGAGKAKVAQNTIAHGILCKQLVLDDESQEEFEVVKQEFYEQFKPESFLEILFCERALSAIWRLSRISKIEALIISDAGTNPFRKSRLSDAFGGYAGQQLGLMSRYEITLEKILFKSLSELRALQYSRMSLSNPKCDPEIGFVSQF